MDTNGANASASMLSVYICRTDPAVCNNQQLRNRFHGDFKPANKNHRRNSEWLHLALCLLRCCSFLTFDPLGRFALSHCVPETSPPPSPAISMETQPEEKMSGCRGMGGGGLCTPSAWTCQSPSRRNEHWNRNIRPKMHRVHKV